MDPLGFDGAWLFSPHIHKDGRGQFLEWFRSDELDRPLDLAQANCSVSARGVLRGLHYADVPPGQAKYVTCVSGSVLDVAVDLRTGSPTFGQWAAVQLDDVSRQAVYLAEGLGHAFFTLSESATVIYLCSTSYAPQREHGIHPLDPALGIVWPEGIEPILSDKDAAAPTLAEAIEQGLLPSYADCLAHYASSPGPQQGRPGRV
ncbi:dTDP-4-dehydrorhamnose 3,5-epimerase [Nonomuraea sp. NPDC052129]|uniref:dTDP-4-dehydrorhamnose 3,5-epimerase family protein n=1 Tax=Nonomuraea sp. NPDC052129 TaxID=3154651 RepID=UPI00341E4202